MRNIDYTMYYVTDNTLLHENYDLYKSIQDSILGGVTIVQLREKQDSTKDFYDKALKVKSICQKYNVPLIINDRIDVAMAIDADGVHIGQEDMPLNIARSILGDKKIIGVSAGNLQEAILAQKNGADYVGVGAMFTTNTKTDAKPTTIQELKNIKDKLDIPIVAIGGINQKTISKLKNTNVDGIAVVTAISMQDNQIEATKKLKRLFYENSKIKACVFDIDGTLTQTIQVWEKVITNLMNKYEFEYTKQDINHIWNCSFEEGVKFTIDKYNISESYEQYFDELIRMSVDEYKKASIQLKIGILDFLDRLKNKDIRLVVCTSLSKIQYETVLKQTGLDKYFEKIFSSTDLGIKKEDFKLYQSISSYLKIEPKDILVFDDDINASIGVKGAGMKMSVVAGDIYKADYTKNRFIDYEIKDFRDENINKIIYL